MITDYFAAPSDALAATVLQVEDGPSTPTRGSGEPLFDTVALPSVDPFVALAVLAGTTFGLPYGEVTGAARHGQVVDGRDEGPFVVTVADELAAHLAAASPHELGEAAHRWVHGGEHAGDAEELARALQGLGELACRAADVRHHLYCWTRWPAR
ncbi:MULTISPECIES: hypothetical protein [unclassified Isoptericola]|uniref:hypothetical protein n=1 Tax=unclassified Isoptericola TaxID=2623355 RepID=UPI002712885D|nr:MULTISPECIES: hypothetical protein [unclassified Isoptericola]MDO8144595.1 hypothetical protein [Isoptericola sp. 178]MDO8148439.1 hypothetical protein [Isoptericola sp. b515]MDO8151921.1 hypothetical protein [Isoptericola sp. b408]